MVAIVSGNNLGLNLGSLPVLGNNGHIGTPTQGRNGERAYVNVSTGGLVLQDRDALLAGVGSSSAAVRTYNSQGQFDPNNAGGWREAPYKSIASGASGTLVRTDVDGSTNIYSWDATRQRYVAATAAGSALDTISVSGTGASAVYTWTDGATGATETYQGFGNGLLLSSTDLSGNTLTYTYDANNRLIGTTNADGESINYTYSPDGLLTTVSTTLRSGQVLSEVSYTYDALDRLQTVRVNLNPSGTVPNGADTLATYDTTYSYDGTSTRVTGVTQGDGTHLAFTYVLVNGDYRVASVTDGDGQVTSFAYDTVANTTTVTDPQQVSSVYQYDGNGELTQIRNGVTASNTVGLTQLNYTYNAIGDVATMTDGLGHTVSFQYDANGNLTSQVDSAGNTQTRTYNAQNQVLTETVYAAPANGSTAASQPQTTRYVYDAGNRNLLRFAISAEGRVTEYRYNAQGLRTAYIAYAAADYNTAGLDQTAVPTEAQMQSWVSGQDLTQSERTDFAYDFRGLLNSSSTYASVDASGSGVASTAATTQYVYDQQGLLLQTVSPDGQTTSQSIYDGLGRVVSSTARSADGSLSATTITQYDDANRKTTVTLANGLSTTSTYDTAGRLVSVVQSSAAGDLGTTRYAYDADGHLLMTQDPTGQRSWFLYDADGRKVAAIDANGKLIEYVYNADDQVTEAIGYDTPVDTTKLVDADGNPTTAYNANPAAAPAGVTPVTLASIRPTATASDARSWNVYDAAGRITWRVDALGRVTQTQYDGASRIVGVTQFATVVDTSQLGDGTGVTLALAGSANAGQAGVVTVSRNAADRSIERIYDQDGRLRATIDGEGYLTEVRYNAAGQPVQTLAYATKVPGFTDAASIASAVAAANSSGSLASLLPAASASDISTFTYYNDRGQVVGQVDGDGYLTETVYDANGRVTKTIRYANPANGPAGVASALASLRPASSPEDHVATNAWDGLGRLASQTNAEGTVTQYAYDSVGNLVSTATALNTADQRTLLTRYDVQGRVVAELSGNGAALLNGNQTQAQIDAVWQQYATTYTYDAAGRRTSQTDPSSNRTVFFYDNVGRLRYTVNAAGEVTENQYDVLGHLTGTSQYATALDALTLAGLQGGLLSSTANQGAGAALAAAQQAAAGQNSTVRFAYDADGERILTQDALGGTTATSYDAFGDQVATTQSIGAGSSVTNARSFDRRGFQTGSVSDVGGLATTASAQYDAFGRLIRSVDANGNVTQENYDQLGRVVSVTDPTGATRGSTYDAFGRVLTQTDALGNRTTYSYDTAQRSITVTSPDGVSMTTVHNRDGQTASVTDGNGNTTTYAYDQDGNLLSTTTPLTATTNQYDAADRLIRTTDANGNQVAYTYDAANRLLSRTVDPDGLHLVTTYQYDAKGQRVGATDANGIVTQTAYDLKGEVVSQTVDPNGLNLTTTYAYDQRGELLTVVSPGGTTTQYAYDQLGRRTQTIVDPNGLHLVTGYTYDNDGNVVAKTDPRGNVTRYAYDADNRVVYTVDGAGDVTHTSYDADGRVVSQTRYQAPIDLTGLGNSVSIATLDGLVTSTPGQDAVQYSVYNASGQLTYSVDGVGDVTKFVYDGNGNVVDRVGYANRADLASWKQGTVPTVVSDPAHDEEVRTVYDALNRAIYTLSSTGDGSQVSVVAQTYDGVGNVVGRTAYANVVPVGTAATAASVAEALGAIAGSPSDAGVRNVYDAANRLTWSADGAGAVTQRVYDADGNLVKLVAYATPVAAGAEPSSVAPSGADRVTLMAYDAADRLTYTVDALGDVAQVVYDANGNVVAHIAYANPVAAPTGSSAPMRAAALASAIVPDASADRITRAAFDSANRQVFTVDAGGAVTRATYDADGRVIATTVFANRIAAASLPINAGIGDIQALLTPDASADRTTLSAFDAAGRKVFSVDALGYLTQNGFDGLGRLRATRLLAKPTAGLTVGADANAMAATLVEYPAVAQNYFFDYDAAGNLLSSVDTADLAESYTYNGLGEKLSFTNKNGDTWTYAYDAAGRLSSETTPSVGVTTLGRDANGNLVLGGLFSDGNGHFGQGSMSADGSYASQWGSTVFVNLVTRFTYDALGNLTARTEAAGTSSERTTRYQYDALGRQIKTIYPPVGVYNASDLHNLTTDGAGAGARSETVQTLSTQVVYDAFGDAIANIDVAGNVSTKTYDQLGRVNYDVDALGYVTGYQRDAFGDVTALTRYANATGVNVGVTAAGANVPTASQVAQALVPSGADRIITTQYDQLGRATQVTQPATWVNNGRGQGYQAAAVTRNTYNAFGQAVQVSVLDDAANGIWATTTNYYDRRGQQIGTVDALGYVTTQGFDAAGNMTSQTQYAQAVAGWTPAALPVPTSSIDDRTVRYTYSALNQKTSMTRVGVLISSFAGTGSDFQPMVETDRADLTTQYGYDAVGNLTSVTDPQGSTTVTYYDALGRTLMVIAPQRSVMSAAGEWNPVEPITLFEHDAFGDVVAQTELEQGAYGGDYGGDYGGGYAYYDIVANLTPSANDRTTLTQYDSHGKATETTDANGHSVYMSYDASGHLAKTWQTVTGNDGVDRTLYTAFQYDALGQQTAIITPASTSVVSGGNIVMQSQQQAGSVTTGMAYNAFGEMVAQGTFATGAGPQYQAYFNYDNAGRLWRTNSGDGNVKVMLYDLQGRQTAQISSAGSTDLSQFGNAQSVDQQGSTGLRRIDSQLDLLGRATQQTLAARYDSTDAGAYRPVVYQTFDRWGNVITQSDVRNAAWVTYYQYNANNQVVRETQPDGNGNLSADSPVTQLYYDGLGRQVAVMDANGHINAQVWDAAGRLVLELHADGGTVQHNYDRFGDEVQLCDALGNVTRYGYDNLGRKTSIVSAPVDVYTVGADNSVSGTTTQLVTTLTYDQAGHKLKQTDGTGATTSYAYDLRGNVVSVTDADGATRTAAFNAQGKQIGAQDANGKLATWSYDAFGQLTGHTDIGGASYQFGYDAARQLVSQTNSRGQNLAYRYDAAGQLTEIDDKSELNQQTYYAYNAAGQHVLEQTVQGGVTYQNQVVAYDTLGRLAHVEGMDGVKLDITYDKVGNKLRQTTTYNTESQRTVADYGRVQQTDESGNPVLDDAGNPVYATVQIGSHTVYDATAHAQDQWFAYDAMNRQILVDGAVNGNAGDLSNLTAGQGHILSYDRNGNRISDESWGTAVVPEYSQNTDASGAPTGDPYLAGYTTHTGVITTWYGYDSLNRLSTVSTGAYGQQQTGTVQKVVPQLDESGNPVLDESGNPITNTVTTPVYSEVALDQSHAVTLDVRRYDGANRVVSSGPVNLPPNGTGVASGTIVSSGNTGPLHASYIEALAGSNTNQPGSTATTTRYDAAGRVLSQHVVNEVDGTRSYDVSYEKTVVTGTHTVQVQTGTAPVLDEAGAPVLDESGSAVTTPVYTTQTVTDTAEVSTYDAAGNALGYRVTQNGTTTDYTFSQALYEGYQEGGVSAVSSAGSSGSTGEQYDANGFLVGLTDSTQGANNRSFVNDANGHILQKNQQGNLLNQLVVNGQVMGIYGVGTDAITPTNSDGKPNYTTQGNFDLGYQPVTNSYPAAATGQYPVKSGDTLQSIAQSAYGDSQLWYQIAQANGLSGNADLRVGQIINIPTRVGGTHNTANTFAPYDPSKVEGSTSPNLPTPSSDDGGGCGVIGQVIMIVVAVVVTIYTAGAAAGAFGAVATGTAGTTAGAVAGTEAALGATAAGTVGGTFTTGLAAMAGGYGAAGVGAVVVGGAVGSIASQAVGNAIGAQHGFSWDQVALSGLAAGVSAGVGVAASGTALAATQGGAGIAAGIGRAAIGSVVTQGVSVAVGLQDHFSWQQVAASAAGGGVGAAVGEMASSALAGSGLNAGVQGLVAGTVAGIASGTTAAVMRGGRVQIAQIAADAFGNALGISLAEANAAPTDVLGEKIAELQQSPIWNDAGNAVSQALATSSLGQASAWNRSMESIVPTPQVVGSGVDSAGRAWYQYDDGVTTHAVPAPVLDVQELPPLSKAQLAAAAQSAAVDAGTNAAAMGITPAQVDASIAAGHTGVLDALSYAGRVTLYKGWDFVTGGFVERQDARIVANAAGQLSDDNFLKATATDAVGSVAAFVVAGQVGGLVAGRVGGYVGAAATGAAAAGAYDLTQQAAQNVTYALTDGEAGRNGVSLDELGNSALFGAALGVGGKYLADYGNYNVRLNVGEPGTLYSNPLPFRLEAPSSVDVESYVAGLATKTTPTSTNAGLFEVEQTGPLNYRVVGGGTAIDADGYRGTSLLDAKYVGDPSVSPYVDGSKVPLFLRDKILQQQQYEFQRYQAVINDPSVPFNSLNVLTNEPKAVPYFQRLFDQYKVPGQVQVVPTNIPQVGPKLP
ncbi:LysM peptidoglycan-binding domain-containing protein [Ralstonia solanacearum]|uniref:LysM peptidoglycan-binding domain-containing protein n=1 Tax=Ralstonia solanacearum TaxID=305 RepID=UPI000AF230F9|nr:LysM peptidoglycan-binding domain-containing protein [Ralstonia solanacearum]